MCHSTSQVARALDTGCISCSESCPCIRNSSCRIEGFNKSSFAAVGFDKLPGLFGQGTKKSFTTDHTGLAVDSFASHKKSSFHSHRSYYSFLLS